MHKFFETITFPKSNGDLAVLAGANATIYQANTMTLATLYEDDEVTTKANPLISDSHGLVSAKLVSGYYDIVFSNGGQTVTITDYDASAGTFDPANVAITGGTLNGVTIGNTSPANGTFNDLTVNGNFKN